MEKDKIKKTNRVLLTIVMLMFVFTGFYTAGFIKGNYNMHTYLRDVTLEYDEMCQEEGYGRMVVDRTIVPNGNDYTIRMSCSAYSNIIYEKDECVLVTFGDNPGEYWCDKE